MWRNRTNTVSYTHLDVYKRQASGCCSEFIVETEKLNGVARSGDISNAHPEWKSAVSKIMVYNKFVE